MIITAAKETEYKDRKSKKQDYRYDEEWWWWEQWKVLEMQETEKILEKKQQDIKSINWFAYINL
jgi:hypothetical protein